MAIDIRYTGLIHTNGRLGFLLMLSAPCIKPPPPQPPSYVGPPKPGVVWIDGAPKPCCTR